MGGNQYRPSPSDRPGEIVGWTDPRKRVVCVGHAAPADEKAEVLHQLGAVAFLDDHPANANAALGTVLVSALLDRGYEGLESPEHGVKKKY